MESVQIHISEVKLGDPREGYFPVRVDTSAGDVSCRYYKAEGASAAVICVGGVGGGFDTPARGLYPVLCRSLASSGAAGMRVCFRHPTELQEAVIDVLVAAHVLVDDGIDAVGIIGHSFGGAVAIQAGVQIPETRAVITLATQSFGAEVVDQLPESSAVLLLHGERDRTLPPGASHYVHDLAREPKRLVRYPGAGHNLDEVADDVHHEVRDWVDRYVLSAAGVARP